MYGNFSWLHFPLTPYYTPKRGKSYEKILDYDEVVGYNLNITTLARKRAMREQERDDWIDTQLEDEWSDLCTAEGCDGPDSGWFPVYADFLIKDEDIWDDFSSEDE
jgi:hypothetical protein